MRSLSDLPVEIFDEVLSFALAEPHPGQLCDFALVNRAWHSRTTAQAYSSWVYNGTRHSFKRLWLFVRSMLGSRHLSSTVRRVHIGNWGVNPFVLLEQEVDYSLDKDDMGLLQQAINRTNLTHIKLNMISDICQGDRRPLIALLLALLPNLITIRAHVPVNDPYLAAVLQQALDSQGQSNRRDIPGPLGELREMYVFAEVSVPAEGPVEYLADIPAAPLQLRGIWPVLFLRSMRKLHLYDLETDGIATLINQQQNHHTSNINDLLIRTLDESRCQPADIKALIRLPQALRNFSLFINDQTPHLRRIPSKISNTDIWEALHEHQREIQFLDLFRTGHQGRNDRTLAHLNSLHDFTQLREIRSQLLHLTGVGTHDIPNEANQLLKDTLPRSLEALWLYWNGHSMPSRPAITKQIQELATEGSHPLLHSITLEDEGLAQAILKYEDHNGRTGLDPLLLKSRVRFEPRGACLEPMTAQSDCCCLVTRAGHCVNSWGDMYEARVDGNRRFYNIMQRISPTNEDEEDVPPLPYAIKIHVLPFTTHTRDTTRPGYMVFENYIHIPLPPFLLFIIYFTHPDALPSTADLQGLYKALTGYEDDIKPRLDIYFLPGATEMDCLAHYTDEQRARGSYKAQIARFQDLSTHSRLGLPFSPALPGRLPGMMLIDEKYPMTKERGILFICTEKNWRDGQQTLCYVRFHSPELLPGTIATEDGGNGSGGSHGTAAVAAEQNHRGHRQPLTISAIDREVKSINRDSPVYEEVDAVDRYIADVNYEADDVLERVWKEASYYGWTNWA